MSLEMKDTDILRLFIQEKIDGKEGTGHKSSLE